MNLPNDLNKVENSKQNKTKITTATTKQAKKIEKL